MWHYIDPTVDYVFKKLLGSEENKDLTLHFLNALIDPPVPFVAVELLNPFVPAELDGDDYRVVDVKARDRDGKIFQIELQNDIRLLLIERMVYTLADIYQSQLSSGADFSKLRPVHALWLLDGRVITETDRWLHRFELRDQESGRRLTDQVTLHTVELRKWRLPDYLPLAPAEQWVYFFRDAKRWSKVPPGIDIPELQKAMAILHQISEKTKDYWRYQERQNFLRLQRTRDILLEQARLEAEQALQDKEQERQAKEQALHDKERLQSELEALRARLRAQGIDPESL